MVSRARNRFEEEVETLRAEAPRGRSHDLEGKGTLRRMPEPRMQRRIVYVVHLAKLEKHKGLPPGT